MINRTTRIVLYQFAVFGVAIGALMTGCGSSQPEQKTGTTSEALCTRASSGDAVKLTFSTSLAPSGEAVTSTPGSSAPLRYGLNATTRIDVASGEATTQWTMTRGQVQIMGKTQHSAGATTTTDVELGEPFQGLRQVHVVNDGSSVTGNADGQPIAPVSLKNPGASGQAPTTGGLPTVQVAPETQAAIEHLLQQAAAEAPAACGQTGTDPAVSALKGSLWEVPAQAITAETQRPPAALASSRVESLTYAGQGVATTGKGSDQNNPVYFATHDCQNCQRDCALNWTSYVFATLNACQASCFIPGAGCAENICSDTFTCDSNEACCGSICCASDSVCANNSLGECCPSSAPVGCGDETVFTCFPAGSTCCGASGAACPSGTTCTNIVGTSAQCCPTADLASDGQCCAGSTCGGQCCDGGTCNNGSCCYGGVDSNGACCGFGAAVCNGQCCNGSCAPDGSCVPPNSGGFNQMGRLSAEGATGEYLFPGQTLYSQGGLGGNQTPSGCGFLLAMQHDGNLVLYGSQAWWNTGTWNSAQDTNYVVLQADGNFVEYAFAGGVVYSNNSGDGLPSNSNDAQDEDVVLQGDGNLVMYRADSSVAFSTTNESWLKEPIQLSSGNCVSPNGYPLISETTVMEANADRPGGDYQFIASPGPVDCANACAQDRANDCLAYSWVPAGAAGNSGAVCAMKSSVPAKVSDGRGVVTGYIRGRLPLPPPPR